MDTFIKKSETELEVTKTPQPVEQVLTYDVKTLQWNKNAIIAELAKFTAEKEKELADIDILLAKCTELGVFAKVEPVVEPKPTEEIPVGIIK